MSSQFVTLERAYEDLLANLWDDLEDLLDSYCGGLGHVSWGVERLRLKIGEFRERLSRLHDQVLPFVGQADGASTEAALLEHFSAELLRLLDVDTGDDKDFDLSCGPTMVRAQNRILEEVRRLALPR